LPPLPPPALLAPVDGERNIWSSQAPSVLLRWEEGGLLRIKSHATAPSPRSVMWSP
jgi:hypothetical protein